LRWWYLPLPNEILTLQQLLEQVDRPVGLADEDVDPRELVLAAYPGPRVGPGRQKLDRALPCLAAETSMIWDL
jgi:hypothetical protein